MNGDAVATALPAYTAQWLTDPDGGGRYTGHRDAIQAHDRSCESLQHVWLPRKGGYSSLSDLSDCDGGCGVTFFFEGVRCAFDECPESWHYYCMCCLSKATQCPCASAIS